MVYIIILNEYLFQHVINFSWREPVQTTSKILKYDKAV